MLPIVTRNFMDFVLFFANKTMSIRTSFDVKSRRQYLQIVNGWWPCQQITIKGKYKVYKLYRGCVLVACL